MAQPEDHGPLEKPHEEKISRVSVPELDRLLGQRFPVLDDGFVRVVDYLGCDESIVQAARVSYGRGTRKVQEDQGLIRYLLRHRHTTPFEMCEIKFHVRVPMDTWRQWIRHRTANVNEYSTRYSIAIDSAQKTPAEQWRLQAGTNRQGSEGYLPAAEGRTLTESELDLQKRSRQLYEERIEKGVAREQARKDLPLSTYTEAYWKVDLWNLLHFLSLRMESHAQEEIRLYAKAMGEGIVAKWVPIVWQAFQDYDFNAMHLSALEVSVLREVLAGRSGKAADLARSYGWLQWDEEKKKWKRNRERDEFEQKLKERFDYRIKWEKPGGASD